MKLSIKPSIEPFIAPSIEPSVEVDKLSAAVRLQSLAGWLHTNEAAATAGAPSCNAHAASAALLRCDRMAIQQARVRTTPQVKKAQNVMAYTVMAYIVMAYVVVAYESV